MTADFIQDPIFFKKTNEIPIDAMTYVVVAKDGVYIEKKKNMVSTNFKKINDGSFCHGAIVQQNNYNATDF